MFNSISKLFGADATDFKKLVKEGAIILDVRTNKEYYNGHIEGAMNISVDELIQELNQLKDKNKPIITYCASGNRSAKAKKILESSGYTNVHDGGGFQSLNNKIQ
jgi:rhodanese-related sulfurtransferase